MRHRLLTLVLLFMPFAAQAQDAPPAASQPLPPPHAVDLSPLAMFLSADPVVKAVMLILALASLASWTVWIAKSLELSAARRRAKADSEILRACRTLNEAAQHLGGQGVIASMAREAVEERDQPFDNVDAMLDRIGLRIAGIKAATRRQVGRSVGILGTIGSTAPFIGLFGTVWGIMNSFLGIAKTQTTTLAVVAPGIAEALLATAAGLVAAVPAVIMYNYFARSIGDYRALLDHAEANMLRLASREVDRLDGRAMAKAAE